MSVGSWIKDARKSKKLTQRELAEMVNKSFSTIQKYENGLVEPPLSVLIDISNVLGVDPAETFDQASDRIFAAMKRHEFEYGDNASAVSEIAYCIDLLNDEGVSKAVERVEELTEIPKYQKTPPPDGSDGGKG